MLRSIHDFIAKILHWILIFFTKRPPVEEVKPAPVEELVWKSIGATSNGWSDASNTTFSSVQNPYNIVGITDCAIYEPYSASRAESQDWTKVSGNAINTYYGCGVMRKYDKPVLVKELYAAFKHRNFMNSKAWIIARDKSGELVGLAYTYAASTSTRQTFGLSWNGVREVTEIYFLFVSSAVVSGTGSSSRSIYQTKIK